jgi:hypothetical protein
MFYKLMLRYDRSQDSWHYKCSKHLTHCQVWLCRCTQLGKLRFEVNCQQFGMLGNYWQS